MSVTHRVPGLVLISSVALAVLVGCNSGSGSQLDAGADHATGSGGAAGGATGTGGGAGAAGGRGGSATGGIAGGFGGGGSGKGGSHAASGGASLGGSGGSTGGNSGGVGGHGGAAGVSGAGGSGAGGSGGAAPAARLAHFKADCAPNDGPAKTFVIDDLVGCGPLSQQVSLLEITVFGAQLASIQSGGMVTVGTAFNVGAQGTSVVVDAGGNVTNLAIAGGGLSFDTVVDGASATGTFSFTLVDGTHTQGAFSAVWCTGGAFCGG